MKTIRRTAVVSRIWRWPHQERDGVSYDPTDEMPDDRISNGRCV